MNTTYNGHKNRETWLIHCEIYSNQCLHADVMTMAVAAIVQAEKEPFPSKDKLDSETEAVITLDVALTAYFMQLLATTSRQGRYAKLVEGISDVYHVDMQSIAATIIRELMEAKQAA